MLVAQIGARRRYAVPRGLAQAGCLQRVVTDACNAVRPWNYLRGVVPPRLRPRPLRAVLDRHIDGVTPDRIQGCVMFFLATRVGASRARPGESKASFWVRQNEAFGRAVVRLDWGNADTAYAFNGAALEIFQRARQHGVRCVLDQTAAPWRYNTQLLGREQARWPGWEECPADMDPGGHMMAREEAEWELADQIVCGSPFVVEAIRSVGGPIEKCRVVPYPVPDIAPMLEHKQIRPRSTPARALRRNTSASQGYSVRLGYRWSPRRPRFRVSCRRTLRSDTGCREISPFTSGLARASRKERRLDSLRLG